MRNKKNNIIEQLRMIRQPTIDKCFGKETNCSKIDHISNKLSESSPDPHSFNSYEANGEPVIQSEEIPEIKPFCTIYAFPATKWRNGNCPMATHLEIVEVKKDKVRVGQQKQKQKKKA